MARPPKLTKAQRKEVFDACEAFIDNEDDPALVYFVAYDPTAIKYRVTKDNINDWDEFSILRKRSIQKQEAYLSKQGTRGRIDKTMAIFRLKQPQHGYTDKQQVENSGEQHITVEVTKYADEDTTTTPVSTP